jgi:hypothetical protein
MKWLLFAICSNAFAHDLITTKITWTREISRIVFKRCAACHHEGGAAPMPLLTYEEARPWAKAIKEEVLERRMPPWGAMKGFGEFRDDTSLSQEEIEMLADWVEGGAPNGEERYLPSLPRLEPPPKPAARGRELPVSAHVTLAQDTMLTAIRPKTVPAGAAAQVIARRPDGSVEPLLWLYRYQPKAPRTYVYRNPISLPRGTRIEVSPAGAGAIALITSGRSPAR